MTYKTLSNDDKVSTIRFYDQLGPRGTSISRLTGFNESTIGSFWYRYEAKPQLEIKRGRPPTIFDDVKQAVIGVFDYDGETTLKNASFDFDLSKSTIKSILNDDAIKYMKKTPVPAMKEEHFARRKFFCSFISGFEPNQVPNIIITDESTVEIDCHKPGIWRRRGHHPPLSLYNAEQKLKTVMVWAGIERGGYRTELLRVKGRLNSEAYCNLLINNGIVKNLNDTFGTNYIFQQDNAPCHRSAFTKDTLLKKFPAYLNWRAKSPDLSPIEQLWHYLKHKLENQTFSTLMNYSIDLNMNGNQYQKALFILIILLFTHDEQYVPGMMDKV